MAYLGDVIDDIAAMAAADIAIGLAEDELGFISKTVCDIVLGGDILWLSRLFVLSRNFVEANRFNTNLIVPFDCFFEEKRNLDLGFFKEKGTHLEIQVPSYEIKV